MPLMKCMPATEQRSQRHRKFSDSLSNLVGTIPILASAMKLLTHSCPMLRGKMLSFWLANEKRDDMSGRMKSTQLAACLFAVAIAAQAGTFRFHRYLDDSVHRITP